MGGTKRPNMVVVLVDDLDFGDTDLNGNEIIKTPEFDKMAEQGLG